MRTRTLMFGWLGVAAGILLAYRLSHRSGVTDSELIGRLPGDDLIGNPVVEWTRATTIDAAPSAIWPWLVQMGFGRGGWYTSVLFDRLVWHLENPSSEIIIPEYQSAEIEDIVPDGPNYAAYFRIAELEPQRWIVYRSLRHPYKGHPVDPADKEALASLESKLVKEGWYLDFSWAWVLQPSGGASTRMLVRTRANCSPSWIRWLAVPLGLVDHFHTTTMFRGISKRARSI